MEVIPSYIVAGERLNRLLGRVTIRRGSLDEFKGSAGENIIFRSCG